MNSAALFDIAGVSNENDEWYTPSWFFRVLGVEFDLDPCSPGAPPSSVPARRHLTKVESGQQDAQRAAAAHLKSLKLLLHQTIDSAISGAPAPVQNRATPAPVARSAAASQPEPTCTMRKAKGHAGPQGDLTGPEQRILDAIAWLESTTGKPDCEQTAVAFLAGYTVDGGGFKNPRGALNGRGLIEARAGTIRLTEEGRALANIPEAALTAEELHRRIMDRLPGPEQRILQPLLAGLSQQVVCNAPTV